MSKQKTLTAGILSPFVAAGLGAGVYMVLTGMSQDRDSDFVFRLTMTSIAMAVPFVFTLMLAWREQRAGALVTQSKMGLAIATLSLGMLYLPIQGAMSRARQVANLALKGTPAPEVATTDISGNIHRISDHKGKVILLNIWATWCAPCRAEMPQLDQLYKNKADRGLMVFGLSMEESEVQRAFAEEHPVSYPLLTTQGEVPDMFQQTVRYPANFLIDRRGQLQPAPSTDQPFKELVALVDRMLREPAP